ncbi:MAG: ParB/RepB/Spo0J family partition protein [Elusimicrobiota bacterium]|jgi:ParB family chromosome partitioning protein|nr:ParB/RepB/Spo0J family partition protein [Elusimicrobiota bacterium]
MQKQVLGRGLQGLVPSIANKNNAGESVITIPLNKIKPNKFQPRRKFNEEKLKELAESIETHGLVQPILVSQSIAPGEYEIVAGERRWRASKLAGKTDIKAIVKQGADDVFKMDMALIENIQREDLNPIEEALAFKRLLEEFNHTHEEIAQKISKNRSVITNSLRLLHLPQEIQDLLAEGKISSGHGRMLASIEDEAVLMDTVNRILNDKLPVRAVEKLVKDMKSSKKPAAKPEIELTNFAEELQRKFGTKVRITGTSKKGKIEIHYFSLDDLNRISGQLKK